MKGSIGCPTRIIARVPQTRKLAALRSVELSEKAKRRLEMLDWYFRKSARHSAGGKKNVALTCRHFGMHRSQFYRWLACYDKTRLVSPGPGSTAPKRKREAEYSRAMVAQVRGMRKEDPTYSGKKIRPILLRSIAEKDVPSVATIGRLISRERLYFRPDTKLHRKRSNAALKAHERKRKPPV